VPGVRILSGARAVISKRNGKRKIEEINNQNSNQ